MTFVLLTDIRTMSDPKSVEQSLPYKTARAAEWFWLVASIVGTLYVGWLWMSADTPALVHGICSLHFLALVRRSTAGLPAA